MAKSVNEREKAREREREGGRERERMLQKRVMNPDQPNLHILDVTGQSKS